MPVAKPWLQISKYVLVRELLRQFPRRDKVAMGSQIGISEREHFPQPGNESWSKGPVFWLVPLRDLLVEC